MNPHNQHPDARIDHILDALRATAPPIGLEQRIAARIATAEAQSVIPSSFATRIATAAKARFITASPLAARIANAAKARFVIASPFAVILNAVKDPCSLPAPRKLYTAAAALTLLLTLTTLTVLHHHTQITTATATRTTATRIPASTPGLEGAGLQSRRNSPTRNPALAAEGISPPTTPKLQAPAVATLQVPRGFSRESPSPPISAGVLTPAPSQHPDLETIALAETLAPSRPAPPEPLTQQELLALAVLRSGDHEEIAALNPAQREANLANDELAFNKFFAPPKSEPPTPAATTGDKE